MNLIEQLMFLSSDKSQICTSTDVNCRTWSRFINQKMLSGKLYSNGELLEIFFESRRDLTGRAHWRKSRQTPRRELCSFLSPSLWKSANTKGAGNKSDANTSLSQECGGEVGASLPATMTPPIHA